MRQYGLTFSMRTSSLPLPSAWEIYRANGSCPSRYLVGPEPDATVYGAYDGAIACLGSDEEIVDNNWPYGDWQNYLYYNVLPAPGEWRGFWHEEETQAKKKKKKKKKKEEEEERR